MSESGALVAVDTKAILAEYHQRSIADIARSLNVSDVAIYLKLLREKPDEWKEHQAAKALFQYEQAEEAVRTAPDALSLARAREDLRSQAWKLERVCRRIYGQDSIPQGAQAVQININLRGSGATNAVQHEVLDAEPASGPV